MAKLLLGREFALHFPVSKSPAPGSGVGATGAPNILLDLFGTATLSPGEYMDIGSGALLGRPRSPHLPSTYASSSVDYRDSGR
jgi:hypothetical protein